MGLRKASDLFVECLEAEGVKHVFGIPGEETLDLNESLADSSIQFVPVRHEQGGAYMADVYGRLTGRAGVCLGTLGPGATNLVTAVADAFLDRAPLVALTGQADLERMHKESHQYIDVVSVMRPITKWNARLEAAHIIPEVVRKAFKVAESEKPGATHIELPEDVMAEDVEGAPLPRRRPVLSEPSARELLKAADLVRGALNPVALAGNGVIRAGAAPALREFVRASGIPVAETFMGKGAMDPEDPKALGAVGLQAGDYKMAGFEEADVVIAIGYDLVEQSPETWNPSRDKTIVCIDSLPAEIDEYYVPEVELVGDIYHVLSRLSEECRHVPHSGGSARLREVVLGRFEAAKDDEQFPMQPPRALYEIRRALGREDILVSDVGLHK
ncbi:MAG: thiamine pyrophosphate-binding protein, partial [Thermoleophilaceae bacterium]